MSENNVALIKFLNAQKESGKYESFVWAEALGVYVVSCYGETFAFHFSRWNGDHGIAFTLQVVSANRFIIFM